MVQMPFVQVRRSLGSLRFQLNTAACRSAHILLLAPVEDPLGLALQLVLAFAGGLHSTAQAALGDSHVACPIAAQVTT